MIDVEAGVPVHADNDWHVPELVCTIWTAGQIQDALTASGFTAYPYDERHDEPCECEGNAPDCAICQGTGTHPLTLRRNRRWVKGDQALRVPVDRGRVVSPYLAACVVALLA